MSHNVPVAPQYQERHIRSKIHGPEDRKLQPEHRFSCPDCPYITSSKFCYKSHRSTHARGSSVRTRVDPATLTCPQCGKISQSRSHHQAHIGRHARRDDGNPHVHICPSPDCNYTTANAKTYASHRDYNHAPKSCPRCPFTCEGAKRLAAHRKAGCNTAPQTSAAPSITTTSPNVSTPIHRCTTSGCTYETPLVANFRTHYHYHHRQIECHGCSRTFEGRKNLKIHERTNCGGSRS